MNAGLLTIFKIYLVPIINIWTTKIEMTKMPLDSHLTDGFVVEEPADKYFLFSNQIAWTFIVPMKACLF